MGYANRKLGQEAVITAMEAKIAEIETLKREFTRYYSLPLVCQIVIERLRGSAGMSVFDLEDKVRRETGYIGENFYEEFLAPSINLGYLKPVGDRVFLSKELQELSTSILKTIVWAGVAR